jgi:diguanylate cyclase (GGDEF)-like protein
VTDRRLAEDKIKHLANFDTLTGLPNRRQLFWRSERAIEHARRLHHGVALLQIGLDRFKIINENLGHHAGDELLIEVAHRLRNCVRHFDECWKVTSTCNRTRSHRNLEAVGRLGADEFVVLLPEVHPDEAMEVAHRILDALRAPMTVGGQECFVTASIGVAVFPAHGVNGGRPAAPRRCGHGPGQEPGPQHGADVRSATGQQGPRAPGSGHGAAQGAGAQELVLYYQPKVDVRTHRMVGVEALMRWQRDDQLVSPADFIPLAEATGLINEMSLWAIAKRRARPSLADQFGLDHRGRQPAQPPVRAQMTWSSGLQILCKACHVATRCSNWRSPKPA